MSKIIWLEGLSGAGKSTIADHLATRLTDCGYRVKIVDGDQLRTGLCSDLGFGIPDRVENVRRAAHLASILANTVDVVIVALITPLESMRAIVRTVLPMVIEVFVNAPIDVCAQRDPKGHYRKAREGKLKDFSGIDSPFEIPKAPQVVCHTDRETIEESAMKVFSAVFHSDRARTRPAKGSEPLPWISMVSSLPRRSDRLRFLQSWTSNDGDRNERRQESYRRDRSRWSR